MLLATRFMPLNVLKLRHMNEWMNEWMMMINSRPCQLTVKAHGCLFSFSAEIHIQTDWRAAKTFTNVTTTTTTTTTMTTTTIMMTTTTRRRTTTTTTTKEPIGSLTTTTRRTRTRTRTIIIAIRCVLIRCELELSWPAETAVSVSQCSRPNWLII